MRVTTRNGKATPYTAQAWIEGAAGFVDADPNVTGIAALLAAGRVLVPPADTFNTGHDTSVFVGGPTIFVALADGTSATVSCWVYDDAKAIWHGALRSGKAAALTYAAGNIFVPSIGIRPGARFFWQIVANNGVTKFAAGFR